MMYEFPHLVAASASVLAELEEMEDDDTAELSAERPVQVAQQTKREPVSRANKPRLSELPAFRHLAEPAKPVYRRTPEDGALTREVMAGEARTPSDVKASLTVGSHTLKVEIISLGLKSMFVLTPYSPGKTGDRATVEFELRVRGGMADISCKCDVLAVDDGRRTRTPGFELRINRLNEGRNKGVLHDYVRWLTFRNIATRE